MRRDRATLPAMLPIFALVLTVLGCTAASGDSASTWVGTADTADDGTRPWRRSLPSLSSEVTAPRGFHFERAIVHLHSTWSHDACDGEPFDDSGAPRRDCLDDLRRGLCESGIDHAFLTDHPSYFSSATWDDDPTAGAFLPDDGGTLLPSATDPRVYRYTCDDGRVVNWYPGVEDEIMPVGLNQHVPGDAAERDTLYNQGDAAALTAFADAGAVSMLAHTEGRDIETLKTQVDEGLQGVEVFNLHAAFDPTIRSEDLGLDPTSWLIDMAMFTAADTTAQPDLFVLLVLLAQTPSETAWDTLNATGPDDRVVVATAGTDAHQNVFPSPMVDGERPDSYRRMLRWFSQYLWMDGDDLDTAKRTLAAGRFHIAFEALGTPQDFDFHLLGADGTLYEMGSALTDAVLPATLELTCPTLTAASPQGTEAPEISATVYRDGEPWQTDCGSFAITEPGTYRVRIDMIPWHLAPFLGDDADMVTKLMHSYPWVYGNPIRIRSTIP
ncbi:MAG: hypothetical protein GXP62_15375 [Oligoflexia bacterium]|nr:hypothetical protein [Oligoflexia bacterium]